MEGQVNVAQIFKEANKKGIKCSRANFWNLLRNPVYCGRIYLSAYKEDGARHVEKLHAPIISEALFYEVQDFLDVKKKIYRTKLDAKEIFQLRGLFDLSKVWEATYWKRFKRQECKVQLLSLQFYL